MKKKHQHIVNKVNLEINTTRKETAFELKNKIDSFLKERLFPELELLFNEISSPEHIRRFEKVQLEFELRHTTDLNLLAEEFVSQLRTKLAKTENFDSDPLINAQKEENKNLKNENFSFGKSESKMPETLGEKVYNRDNNQKNTFIHFLETGRLPWYAVPELLEEFVEPIHFEEALRDRDFVEKLKMVFHSHPESLTRFINQFSNQTIEFLIVSLWMLKGMTNAIKFNSGNRELQPLIYELIIAKLINSDLQRYTEIWERLQSAVKKASKTATRQNRLLKQATEILSGIGFSKQDLGIWENEEQISGINNKKIEQQPTYNQEIYIRNAGLILAHPFLKELLKRANCLVDLDQIRDEKRDYAVHLLHFLCTGEEKAIEYELTFEKILCGMPTNWPVSRNIELQEKDKVECVDLLKSIVENWTVLKNTSSEGLRQNFFQRNGKLDLNQSPIKLYVERNTIDILLEKLPWSVSVVKLPWMNDLIFVEW